MPHYYDGDELPQPYAPSRDKAYEDLYFAKKIATQGESYVEKSEDRHKLMRIILSYAPHIRILKNKAEALKKSKLALDAQLQLRADTGNKEVDDKIRQIEQIGLKAEQLAARNETLQDKNTAITNQIAQKEHALAIRRQKYDRTKLSAKEQCQGYWASSVLCSVAHSVTMKRLDVKLKMLPRVHMRMKRAAVKLMQEMPALRVELLGKDCQCTFVTVHKDLIRGNVLRI